MLVVITMLVSLLMVCVTLMPAGMVPTYLPGALGGAIILVTFFFLVRFVSTPEEAGDQPPEPGWTWSLIYSNPDDPSVFVPKRLGIGYTLNMANPLAWVILSAILLLGAVAVWLATQS